ncbi:MAG: translation initiation factor IF-3 [Bacillus subtilis]|nr:translation initiation factor IF-3 [Bacillus subtilis]
MFVRSRSGYSCGIHFFPFRRCSESTTTIQPVKKDDAIINENIRAKEVLLIGAEGFQYRRQAHQGSAVHRMQRSSWTWFCVAPARRRPSASCMNYSKYRYEQQRQAREAKKNQHIVELKEIRLTAVIDTHDFETKLQPRRPLPRRMATKLKVSVRLPNRFGLRR